MIISLKKTKNFNLAELVIFKPTSISRSCFYKGFFQVLQSSRKKENKRKAFLKINLRHLKTIKLCQGTENQVYTVHNNYKT